MRLHQVWRRQSKLWDANSKKPIRMFECACTSIQGWTFAEPSLVWKTIPGANTSSGLDPYISSRQAAMNSLPGLEQKYYVLPGTKRPYAEVPLVMVVPEALVDAPTSFESLAQHEALRIAVGDPALTTLGQKTMELLTTLGVWGSVENRLDRASDMRSVLDHVLNGEADVGILFGPDAIRESQSVRIVAVAERGKVPPVIHSMAMERYCPNRALCEEFLRFAQSPEAQAELKRLGYASPLTR